MNRVRASLPIREVMVLEDRAHVVREGVVTVAVGSNAFTLDGLSPVLVDKSVIARVLTDTVRVLDTRVVRSTTWLPAELGESWSSLEALERTAIDACDAARAEIARLDAEIADLGTIAGRIVEELTDDVAFGTADVARSRNELASIRSTLSELMRPRAERAGALRILERERADLGARRQAAGQGTSKDVSNLAVTIEAPVAGEHTLRVEYVVPCAAWRPRHVATLRKGTLEFRSDASVWQHTGEDWTNAMLRFSTERPSLGATPPTLGSDVLRSTKRAEQVVVAMREQVVEDTGLGKAKVAVELPGIDDGGARLDLRAESPVTIPSDGRPYRVPLFRFESPAVTERIVVGERAAAVILRSEHDHTGTVPILAGPVDLVRESGLVGRTSTLFVAPGERFELGFGPEVSLRVHREAWSAQPEKGMLSSWQKIEKFVRISISHLGPDPVSLRVRERIPVSEVEKVKVALANDRCEPKSPKADAHGFVDVPVELEPFGHAVVNLVYVIEKHDDVVGVDLR